MPDIKQKQRTPIKNINKKIVYAERIKDHAVNVKNRTKDFINQISTKLNGVFDTALFPVLSSIQDEPEKLTIVPFKSVLNEQNSFINVIINMEDIWRI